MTAKYMVVVELTNGQRLALDLTSQDQSHADLEGENKILHGVISGQFEREEIKVAGVAYHPDYQIQQDDPLPGKANPVHYNETIH